MGKQPSAGRVRAFARLAWRRQSDRERVTGTTRLLRALTPPAILVASVLAMFFAGDGAQAMVGLAVIVVPCLLSLMLLPRLERSGSLAFTAHLVLAAALGLGWSMLTGAAAVSGAAGSDIFAPCVQVALVSVGVILYSGLPLAFAAFSAAPMAALFAACVRAGISPLVAGALLAGYLAILLASLFERGRMAQAGRESARRLGLAEAERVRAAAVMADERARRQEAERRAVADAERHALGEAERARRAELMLLGERFEGGVVAIADELARIVPALEAYAGRLSGITDAAVDGARATAGRARDISAAVHDLQSRSESLGAAIAAIADRTADHATRSGQALSRTADSTDAVRRLASRAARVDEIVDLIDQVTSRTNLLALNATIEAARAGETGRGFAIVAGEVKTLAAQTAASTVVAREQVREMAQSLGAAVSGIEAAGTDIREVADIAGAIRAEVERQNELASGMAPATRAIAAHVDEVRDRMVAIAGGADDARELSTGIQASAAQINADLDTLKRAAAEFLGRLRAA